VDGGGAGDRAVDRRRDERVDAGVSGRADHPAGDVDAAQRHRLADEEIGGVGVEDGAEPTLDDAFVERDVDAAAAQIGVAPERRRGKRLFEHGDAEIGEFCEQPVGRRLGPPAVGVEPEFDVRGRGPHRTEPIEIRPRRPCADLQLDRGVAVPDRALDGGDGLVRRSVPDRRVDRHGIDGAIAAEIPIERPAGAPRAGVENGERDAVSGRRRSLRAVAVDPGNRVVDGAERRLTRRVGFGPSGKRGRLADPRRPVDLDAHEKAPTRPDRPGGGFQRRRKRQRERFDLHVQRAAGAASPKAKSAEWAKSSFPVRSSAGLSASPSRRRQTVAPNRTARGADRRDDRTAAP